MSIDMAIRAASASPTASQSVTATARGDEASGASEDFSSMLSRIAVEAAQTMREGEKTAMAGIVGQASTQQVVESIMAAERALHTTMAIRDKAVSAYLEISRMAI